MNITNGHVSIEDGTKAAEEYAPARKVRVELHFAVPEGTDADKHIAGVANLAQSHVSRLLGKAAAPVTEGTTAALKATTTRKKAETPAPAAEKTKADLAREAGLPTDELTTETAKADEDDLSDVLGDAAPQARVISDKELGEEAGKVNAKKKAELGDKWAPSKIREVVAQFCGKKVSDVPKITDVPADKREEFLKALHAL